MPVFIPPPNLFPPHPMTPAEIAAAAAGGSVVAAMFGAAAGAGVACVLEAGARGIEGDGLDGRWVAASVAFRGVAGGLAAWGAVAAATGGLYLGACVFLTAGGAVVAVAMVGGVVCALVRYQKTRALHAFVDAYAAALDAGAEKLEGTKAAAAELDLSYGEVVRAIRAREVGVPTAEGARWARLRAALEADWSPSPAEIAGEAAPAWRLFW